MKRRQTAWDQELLKKFSNTGHFRLLNQVRTELRAQPLQRDKDSRNLRVEATPQRISQPRVNRRPNALEQQDNTDRRVSNEMPLTEVPQNGESFESS